MIYVTTILNRSCFYLMHPAYTLRSIQKIPASLAQTWAFFSNPNNLFDITPPQLNLKVTNKIADEAYAGQLITYTVKPLLGVPLNWETEITEVAHQQKFTDNQRKGPYSLWHHQHFFTAIPGGVEMADVVHYRLPLGLLGNMAHALFIKAKLEEIFSYRFHKINEMFGAWPGAEMILNFGSESWE